MSFVGVQMNTLMSYFLDIRNSFFLFFLKLAIIYNNLMDYDFIKRGKTFIFLLA